MRSVLDYTTAFVVLLAVLVTSRGVVQSASPDTHKYTGVLNAATHAEIFNSTRTERVTVRQLADGSLDVVTESLTAEPPSPVKHEVVSDRVMSGVDRIEVGDMALSSTHGVFLNAVVGQVQPESPSGWTAEGLVDAAINADGDDPEPTPETEPQEPTVWDMLKKQDNHIWLNQHTNNHLIIHQGPNIVLKVGATKYFMTTQTIPIGEVGSTTVLIDNYTWDTNPWWTTIRYRVPKAVSDE